MDCFSLQIKLDSLDGPIYFTLSISIFFNFSIRDIFKWFLCPLEIFLSFSSLLSTRCSVLISSTIWKEFKIDDCLERILGNFWVSISVTRLDNLLHFGQLFKACGKNYFAQIAHISGNFSKGVKKFLWNNFWATFIDIWRLFTGHTRLAIYKTKSSEWIQRNIL